MYQRILVATDGTPLAKKASQHAIKLAEQTGAQLVVVTVVPRYPMSYFEGGNLALEAQDIARIEQQWNDSGQAKVDAVAKAALAAGVKHCKAVVVKSESVSDALLGAATKHKCDLIVMASHGRSGIKRLLLGSETQHVLTRATVPVLVLK